MSTSIDKIYFESIDGLHSPSSDLATYGPHVDVWPTKYRTLGFGELGSTKPAVAYCIGAVGALAVRAGGGEGGAASDLSDASGKGIAGLTLHSSTMVDALDNIRRGGGRHAALSIAANLADESSPASLRNALLSEGALRDALGESVGDIGSSRGKASTAAGNQLGVANGEAVIRHSRLALKDFVRAYFDKAFDDDDLLLVHAYTALSTRAKGLAGKNSPGARTWLGGLVEAYGRLSNEYDTKELEKLLHAKCLAEYKRASKQGIVNRNQGLSIRNSGNITVPEIPRTAAEAVQYRVDKGVPRTEVFDAMDVIDDGGEPLSYTAQQRDRIRGSVHVTYQELIRRGLTAYWECMVKQRAITDHQQQRIQSLRGPLYGIDVPSSRDGEPPIHYSGLLEDRPHLDPQRLTDAINGDQLLIDALRGRESSAAAQELQIRAFSAPSPSLLSGEEYLATLNTWRSDLTALLVASTHQWTSKGESVKKQIDALPPQVVTHVLKYVRENIGLFTERRLSDLSPEELGVYELTLRDVRAYEAIVKTDGTVTGLDEPPLHLSMLVANILNFNSQSVLPVGILGKIPRRQNEANAEIEAITSAVRAHVIDRYNLTGKPPSKNIVGLLLECDIAERRGFFDPSTNYEERQQMAQRMREVGEGLNVLDRRKLPAAAKRALEIADQILESAK